MYMLNTLYHETGGYGLVLFWYSCAVMMFQR
jgi:hypothetical protein